MARIGELVVQNPWWKYGRDFTLHDVNLSRGKGPVFFRRRDFELLKEEVYVLRGSRQIGKTVYLKDKIRRLIEGGVDPRRILYLSFDFFTSRRELRNALGYFFDTNRDANEIYLFMDEITTLRDWNLELKYLSDSGTLKRAKTVITGSSGSSLRKGELVPGRRLEGNEYHLRPLPFREFVMQSLDHLAELSEDAGFRASLRRLGKALKDVTIDLGWGVEKIHEAVSRIVPFKEELSYFFRIYLATGGFPAVVNSHLRSSAEGKGRIEPEQAEVFVRSVVGDMTKQGKQEGSVREILKMVIEKYGTRYSFRKLGGDVGITHATLEEYLWLLQESFILRVLNSFDLQNERVRHKGDKKIFFQDPFILYSLESYLAGKDINDVILESLQDEMRMGSIVEGIVCSHLEAAGEVPFLKEVETFLWYYYDQRRELDFVVRTNGGMLGIEVKYQNSVGTGDVPAVGLKKCLVLSKEDFVREGDALIIPVDLFLPLLGPSKSNL